MASATQVTNDLLAATRDNDLAAFKKLLSAGGDTKAKTSAGATLLHVAATGGHMKFVELLVEQGVVIDERDKYGKTPLHCAARGGYEDIAALLIDKGADVNAQAKNGSHPLDWAIKFEHEAMAAFLKRRGAESGKTLA